MTDNPDFSILLGETIAQIKGLNVGSDEVVITLASGVRFRMFHNASCCESVRVEDICGDVSDLLGAPLGLAECVSSLDRPADRPLGEDEFPADEERWTFYKLATMRGSVAIRWLGTSNGYYSTRVAFELVEDESEVKQ